MLIDPKKNARKQMMAAMGVFDVTDVLSMMMHKGTKFTRLEQGVFLTHFNDFASHDYDGVKQSWDTELPGNPEFPVYGVCDSPEQLLAKMPPEIRTSDRTFAIRLTPIRKADQPERGGWRWHKWGEYIGDREPQCEYIHDEPEIDEVYVYSIVEFEQAL